MEINILIEARPTFGGFHASSNVEFLSTPRGPELQIGLSNYEGVQSAMMRMILLSAVILTTAQWSRAGTDWQLWKNYTAVFMDNQVRVIDHDAGDRTTSEGQAYAMFFALVANDRSRFDGLLKWTELNLASGDLAAHLPAWSWGHNKENRWEVLDSNSAADADVWMAYTLLEAGEAWKEPRYTLLGTALAKRIASEEVVQLPGLGAVLLPAPRGFQNGTSYRLNMSYMPLQLFLGLSHELRDGPWEQVAANVLSLLEQSVSSGFATDWTEFTAGSGFTPSQLGSYDAIRVYLWAGMLNPATPGRDTILKSLLGMVQYLHSNGVPPAKVKKDGTVEDPRGAVGFSAALLPYLSALGEKDLQNVQSSRLRAELNPENGLYGKPAKYYDQNLALFSLGWTEHRFWFDPDGSLKLGWKS